MAVTLYAVPASHPCAVVERALQLKGMEYRRVDLLPLAHVVLQTARFGGRTVPGAVIDGEKVQGSRRIVRRLEALAPAPSLFPAEREARAEVERAEEWGDEVLQPMVRRLLWAALRRSGASLPSYSEGADLPIPVSVAALGGGVVAALEVRLNRAADPNVQADLRSFDHHLARVDRWVEAGVLGGETVNAADLQVASGLRLLLTVGDLAPLIDPRPAGRLARSVFPEYPGHVAPGALPASWLPQPAGT